jgi:hypothetical protein
MGGHAVDDESRALNLVGTLEWFWYGVLGGMVHYNNCLWMLSKSGRAWYRVNEQKSMWLEEEYLIQEHKLLEKMRVDEGIWMLS